MTNLPIILKSLWPHGKPKVTVRDPTTISRQAKVDAHEIRDSMYPILSDAQKYVEVYGSSTDLWTDLYGYSYMGFTIYFITENFELKKLVPFVMLIEKRHT